MKTEHTPTPWVAEGDKVIAPNEMILGAPGQHIAFIRATAEKSNNNAAANAVFIVDACNSHDRLKYLLGFARHAIETPGDFLPQDITELLNEIDELLPNEQEQDDQ